jgi:hypothetical protein
METPKRRWGRRGRVAAAVLALAVAAGPALAARLTWWPPSRVHVVVNGVPAEALFVYLVADTERGPEPLRWYQDSFGTPLAFEPVGTVFAHHWTGHTDSFARDVEWRPARRLGVVTRDRDRAWRVRWFGRDGLDPRGRLWLLGGGEVRIDLPDASAAETPGPEFLRRAGLSP